MIAYALRFTEDELHQAIKASAQNNRRSLNAEIMRAIEYYLKNAPEAHYLVEKPAQVKEKPVKKSS